MLNTSFTENPFSPILFDVLTPLGFYVRTTEQYWQHIITAKHRSIADKLTEVKMTLGEPAEIHRSLMDDDVLLFYRPIKPGRWLCCVTRRLEWEGFLITAYLTDNIKEGEQIWRK